MLQSPSATKKNSILKAIMAQGKWANQITPAKIENLQLTGDLLLLGKFSMDSLSKKVDMRSHDLFDKDSMLGIFIARMWTEMQDDGIGMFFDENGFGGTVAPIVSQKILDEEGKRVGTTISTDHDSGSLYVAVEMVGSTEELEEFAGERLLWPDIVIRSARCPRCGVMFDDGNDICIHVRGGGVKPIVRGYAESITLRADKPHVDDIGAMFLEQEEFLDLQPVIIPNSSRRISSGIELFRFIVTDNFGLNLLKIGPNMCVPGRELLLSADEVEQWVDAEDYEEGHIVFLGTVNGNTSKSLVEDMIIKKPPKMKEEEPENVGTTGFEFPE
jgi:hypothetical protein